MSADLTGQISRLAYAQGAAVFGVGDAAPFDDVRVELDRSKADGRSGPLRFTFDEPGLSTNVSRSFPWARSLVSVGYAYLPAVGAPAPTGAVVGRFAARDNYEPVRAIVAAIVHHLHSLGHQAEGLIDDNRLVDRAASVRGGLGWPGKSTMVLAPGHGPWLLFGSIVTDASLKHTGVMRRTCGSCVACIPACPTSALDGRRLDARRCLATWLQAPGSIPQWIRPRLGRRIYGCDDCLIACPPGARSMDGAAVGETLPFAELLALDDEELLDRFRWWYVPRRQGRFIRRNLLVAAGNSGEPSAIPAIESHLTHPSSMIRGHAYWAMARASDARALLRQALEIETVPEARDELLLSLLMAEHPRGHDAVLEADEAARMDRQTRALALIGPHAEGRGGLREPSLLAVGAEAGLVDFAGIAMVRVYDPERLLERARAQRS